MVSRIGHVSECVILPQVKEWKLRACVFQKEIYFCGVFAPSRNIRNYF